jgi:putative nucleotidyltransferase-like protein
MGLLSPVYVPRGVDSRNIVLRCFELENPEIPAHDRNRHVEDGDGADEALEGTGVAVSVEDDVRAMLGDGPCEAVASEERPDPGWLAFEGRGRRGVVEQDDAVLAAGDGVEPVVQGLDFVGRLRVHRTQARLAEVREGRVGEAAHEALRADDPHVALPELEHGPAAVEHDHIGGLQNGDDLGGAVGVPVVVSEDCDDGNAEPSTGVRENRRLLGLPVCGQVAREEHGVGLLGDLRERCGDRLAVLLAAVDVAGRCDSNDIPFGQSGEEGTRIRTMPNEDFTAMLWTLKRCAGALREAGVPFMLGGGLACWARGGPESDHDLDLMVKPEDAEQALATLAALGLRAEKPPEGWLYKAFDEQDVMVDIIFAPVGVAITDDVLARADMLEVEAQPMLVMTLEDVLVTKLLALDENSLDYKPVVQIARSLREQIDWEDVRSRTAGSPYAAAFFTLVEALGVAVTVRNGG